MSDKKISYSRLIASGFGSGLAPFSPGTFGTAAATLLWIIVVITTNSALWAYALALLFLSLAVGIPAVSTVLKGSSSDDPSWVVIDEWAGIFLTLAITPQSSPLGIFLAFALFRVFDIVKLGPVGWAERLGGAWGVMADDLVAGILAALVLLAVF